MSTSIISGFAEAAARFPHRIAVRLERTDYSYGDLHAIASAVARAVAAQPGEHQRLAAVFANRSLTAFAGITGTLLAGRGYVPVNPSFPAERVRFMLEKTGCRTVIAEAGSLVQLGAALRGVKDRFRVIVPAGVPGPGERELLHPHELIGPADLPPGDLHRPRDVNDDDLAYVMFTSGSTGTPKGVMTTHANVRWIVEALDRRYHITPEDRLSLNADTTFSASVLVLFLAFNGGATVCCPTKTDLLNPGGYIAANGITVWKCVPSLAVFMDRLRQLREGAFPTVRITTFGGETVPADIVERWRRAAPNSIIENVYGSTEMSVNTTFYLWDDDRSRHELFRGSVPIGTPLPGVSTLIVDEELREVEPGVQGELLAGGPLVTAGYIGDEERTRAAYVVVPGKSGPYFRTGDIVISPPSGKPIVYVGRRDNQIKVLGNRIELGEVEAISREALGTRDVAALGWPPSPRGFDGIEIFVGGWAGFEPEAFRLLKEHLPQYMLPRRVRLLERLPLNPSGKIDRPALRAILENDHS